jgi:hypothetical protein
MAVPVPSISCCVLNHHNFFYQMQNALAFNWDTCCHLVLCLQLLPFHFSSVFWQEVVAISTKHWITLQWEKICLGLHSMSFSFIIEGTTQFIMPPKSTYNKNFVFNEQKFSFNIEEQQTIIVIARFLYYKICSVYLLVLPTTRLFLYFKKTCFPIENYKNKIWKEQSAYSYC